MYEEKTEWNGLLKRGESTIIIITIKVDSKKHAFGKKPVLLDGRI